MTKPRSGVPGNVDGNNGKEKQLWQERRRSGSMPPMSEDTGSTKANELLTIATSSDSRTKDGDNKKKL